MPNTIRKKGLGRLVVVAETTLSDESKNVLKQELGGAMDGGPEVTFVAGLGRAAVLAAGREAGKLIYNTMDYLPLEVALGLMPWKEVWVVREGRLWKGF